MRMRVPVPSLTNPTAPPPVPVELAITSPTVKVLPLAFVVSKAIVEPDAKPVVLVPFAPPKLARIVVTLPVVNSPVPPTFKANVPPLATMTFAAVHIELLPV